MTVRGCMQCILVSQAGHDVLGGYMSPVNDAYHKPGLLPAQHRIAMCQLAAAESDLIMVDTWEAAQPDAQRSLVVLDRVQQAVQDHYSESAASHGQQQPEQQASQAKGIGGNYHDASLQETAETPGSSLAAAKNVQHQHQKAQVNLAVIATSKCMTSLNTHSLQQQLQQQQQRSTEINPDHGRISKCTRSRCDS